MTYIVDDSFVGSLHELTTGMRHFEQALRVDRPPSALSFATSRFLPATQGQCSKDVSFVMGASRATALRFRSQAPILCYAYTGVLPHVMAEPIESPASARSSEEQQLIQQLSSYCRQLHWGATSLQLLTVITALAAIILSLVVATYTGSKEFESNARVLKLLAFLSAIFTAMFSSFRLRTKAADLRMAFRMLNTDLMRYRIGELNASQLITSYSKAEERVGHVEVDGLPERSPAKPPEV